MTTYKICVLPGEGIGPEVVAGGVAVLQALPLDFQFEYGDIGYETYQRSGDPLPPETIDKVRAADATLFGAVTTPPDIPNYRSPIIRLRKTFDLYANLRPCKSLPHAGSRQDVNLMVVRENTEDLYSGIERVEDNGARAVTERVITRAGSERVLRFAFDLAGKLGFNKVCVVHKANVLRATCGLFRSVAFEVAKEYPNLQMEEMLVDTCAMELIRQPSQFQVIVTTNMFGDILSDEASMLVGGLGIASSGNIGVNAAVFEPVHGSAPKLAGLKKANPIATILAVKMMLEYLGEIEAARRVENAVLHAIRSGQVTEDLGGNLNTSQAVESIIRYL